MDPAELARAESLVDLGRFPEARTLLVRLVADEPENVKALCLLAMCHLRLKDQWAALRTARIACREAPHSDWPHRLTALALARCGRSFDARVMAERAIKLNPLTYHTHLTRAQVDIVSGGVVDDRTLAAAEEAVRLAPAENDPHRVLGTVLLERGLGARAVVHLREALRLDPNDYAAHNELARAEIRQRKLGRAAAGFAAAAAANPRDNVAISNLALTGARSLQIIHLTMWVALGFTMRYAAAVVGVVVAAIALSLWRGARPNTLRLLRLVLRADRLLRIWAVCLAVAYGCLLAIAFLPERVLAVPYVIAFVSLLTGLLVFKKRRRQSRW